jgi:glutamyl-tRNA reductase
VSVIVVGLNHRSAPLEILERVAVAPAHVAKALADLRSRPSLDEVVVLSTCMRTEVYATAAKFHPAVQDVRNFFCETGFCAPEDIADHLTVLYDDAAIGHLFTVVSGLDSAVLGESEIQGQVRRAWDVARAEGAAGMVLSGLFRHALEVGKRVRSETAIARGTTSVSQAAVALATDHLGGSLAGRRILVLGAGQMGEGMAVALAGSADPGSVVVANRTPARAEALAERVGGQAITMAGLPTALAGADVLLTSTTSPHPILSRDDVEAALAARPDRPLLVVDVAIPRDVEPSVAAVAGVTVLDLDDLRAFAEAGLAERRREVFRVRGIIADEVSAYLTDVTAREVAPIVAALRARADEVRDAEWRRLSGRLGGLDARQRQAVEALTKGIVAKLLHQPTVQLKDAAGTPRGEQLADALRVLFDLEDVVEGEALPRGEGD